MSTDTASEVLDLNDPIRLMRQMSHDMRIPLAALIATSDLLAEGGYDPLTPKQTRAVDRVRRNSRRLVAILDDLMIYVKAEANQYPLALDPFDPRSVVENALDQVRKAAEEKGIALVLTQQESLPTMLLGDQDNIKRILLALLWNAVAATSEGTIQLESAWSAPNWSIRVRDTGCGITPDQIPHLFEPFWRGEERPQTPTSGCGLGLAMTQSLTKLMQGSLTLENTSPQGSTFTLQLPLPAATA